MLLSYSGDKYKRDRRIIHMPVLLNVPYAEKEEVKALGAKWDPQIKKWYAVKDYLKFKKWIGIRDDEGGTGYGAKVISEYIYIVEGMRQCFKCQKMTPVICFGFKKLLEIDTLERRIMYYEDETMLTIAAWFYPMPLELVKLITKEYNFKITYSQTIKESYWGNCCEHCNSLQGNFFLFNEPDSPFAIDYEHKLKIYPVKLKYDIVVDGIEIGLIHTIDLEKVNKIAPAIQLSDTIVRI